MTNPAKNRYVVCYDVCDSKRLRKVHRKMVGFGDPLQYSVFQCDLTRGQKYELMLELSELIHHTEDRVLIVDTGPVTGRGGTVVEFLGRSSRPEDKGPAIVI